MLQIVRSASLPWFSIDAENEDAMNAALPRPSAEEVEKCMNCQYSECIDCIAKRGRTPKRMGRPKVHIDMEILIRMVGEDCTNADIGSALGVSVRTVNRVKKSLKN